MYRLNIDKNKFGDLMALLLFNKFFNKEFIDNSELFNRMINDLEKKGFKSKIFEYYFDTDSNLRSRFKQFTKMIEQDRDVAINIWYDDDENINEDYKQIIKSTVQKVTGKEEPDEEKLNELTEQIINELN